MKDYHPDGTRKKPIVVYAGNPPDPPDDTCRWYGFEGLCHDPDFECPLGWSECCWTCRIASECKATCENVKVK